MKLYVLRPLSNLKPDPWHDWYDLYHGFVVRAETEQRARELCAEQDKLNSTSKYWLDARYVECYELSYDGAERIILSDYRAG